MIQAIVFLPLIGALIAGAIALFGAWKAKRNSLRSSA